MEAHQAKHIIVTGGVISGLGKGIAAASLGMLLKLKNKKVTIQKLDPYLNVDPGTMNPFNMVKFLCWMMVRKLTWTWDIMNVSSM